jgi:mono/diheme cytochrome c family protein
MIRTAITILCIALGGEGLPAAEVALSKLPEAASRPVDFSQEIKPLFEKHCVKCHGAEKQKGGLRLDLKEPALRGGDNFAPNIRPGKSAESPLVHFVAGLDREMQMPPKDDALTSDEIALLRTWIDQGAAWPDDGAVDSRKAHWAFQPLQRPVVPPGNVDEGRVPTSNPVDAFISAKLLEKGLSMQAQAGRHTLIRRLYFDMLGLPPTPEEVAAFVANDDAQAYEKLVERVLASPHYGERWARHWLDVVRFAESDGFETNQPRPNAWRYRDYVIQSLNDDKPYDQFIREQLAGDAFGADEATGFIVGGPWDRVKSPDPVLTAQQRSDELHDMVSTTASAFLGLTVNCARCHNHKFDPISQADYYSMAACFAGVEHGERAIKPPDFAKRQETAAELRTQLAPIEARLAEFEPIAKPLRTLLIDDDSKDEAGVQQLVPRIGLEPEFTGTARGQASDPGDLARFPNLGRNYSYWNKVAGRDVFAWAPKVAGRFHVWVSWGCGWKTHAEDARYILDLDGDLGTKNDQQEIATVDHRKFADGSGEMPGQPLWSGFRDAGIHDLRENSRIVLRGGTTDAYVTADLLCLQETDSPTPQLRSAVTRGKNTDKFSPVEARFVRFTIRETSQLEPCIDELEIFSAGANPHNVALATAGAKATSSGNYPNNPFHRLEHLNDGLYGNGRSWISNEFGKGWVQIEFPKAERIDRVVWSRDRDDVPRYEDRLATRYEIAVSKDGESWATVANSNDRLPYARFKNVALKTVGGLDETEVREVAGLSNQKRALEDRITEATTLPMAYAGKFVKPAATFRLQRGDPMQPKEALAPAGLAQFGEQFSLPSDASDQARRLALANWMTDSRHPLTARVLVNRIWHYHFGTGIVDTPSDFGLNGGRPTHPAMLDWLASEFISHGWSVKHIHRLILTSMAYRQNIAMNAVAAKIDASNRLLWRFPARRLEAEALRDAILAVSGKLDLRMGGPGFDLFAENTNYVKVYATKTKFTAADFRRMIYQSKPRVELDTLFGAFDCPDAGQIQPRRNVSTTPLQALNLLNSEFVIEQAGFFAERVEREVGSDTAAQVRKAFQIAFGRDATEVEGVAAQRLVAEHGLPALCRGLFNANEFIVVF